MLFGRVGQTLVRERLQRADDPIARVARLDHVVDVAEPGSHVRIGELIAILGFLLGDELGLLLLVLDRGDLLRQQHFDCALGAHHGDLGRRPCVVDVAAQMLRAHHAVGAAVGFAQDDRDLRNGRFAVSEQQLGAVDDDAAVFLSGARQEARYVDERHDRNIERAAEPYEAGRFARGVDVEHAGQELRLVRDDADALSVEPGETGHDVRRELGLAFEKVAVVDDAPDYVQHVIGLVRIVRNDVVEHVVQPVDRIGAVHCGSVLHVVRRQEAEQLAQRGDALLFVF